MKSASLMLRISLKANPPGRYRFLLTGAAATGTGGLSDELSLI